MYLNFQNDVEAWQDGQFEIPCLPTEIQKYGNVYLPQHFKLGLLIYHQHKEEFK